MFEAVVEDIRNGLDELPVKLNHEDLGKLIGTSRQTVTDMLRSDRECTKFMYYLKSTKVTKQRHHVENFQRLAPHFRNTGNIKLSLEFLAANNAAPILRSYIEDLRKEGITSVYHFLNVYEILCDIQENQGSLMNGLLERIESLKETNANLRFLKNMLKAYYYSHVCDVSKTKDAMIIAEKELIKINDKELQNIYKIRLTETQATVALFMDVNTQKSRALNTLILKETDFFGAVYQANAYYKIGMSYFFESPDMCFHYLKKSATLYRENGKVKRADAIEANELNIAKVIWDCVGSVEEVKGTPSEAHYLAKIGKEEEALKVISNLNEKSPFTMFYKGLATGKPFTLAASMKMLCDKGMMFYAKLPMSALKNFPEAKELLNLY